MDNKSIDKKIGIRGYLDYYEQQQIVPVSQDHLSQDAYFAHRSRLYRELGVVAKFFEGKNICEFGPGTGRNAEFLLMCGARHITLIDANSSSLRAINDRIELGALPNTSARAIHGDFTDITSLSPLGQEKFDFVIAENCLHGQQNPVAALQNVASFVAPGGVLIVSASCSMSVLADNCRRLMKPILMIESSNDFDQAVLRACAIFQDHLDSLNVKTRQVKDWVLDQIFHSWPVNWELPIDVLVGALPDFEFLRSAPNLVGEQRWFKQLADLNISSSEMFLTRAGAALPILVDCRVEAIRTDFPLAWTAELRQDCKTFSILVDRFWHSANQHDLRHAVEQLDKVNARLVEYPDFSATSLSVSGFSRFFGSVGTKTTKFPDESMSWFSRGTQYVALERKP